MKHEQVDANRDAYFDDLAAVGARVRQAAPGLYIFLDGNASFTVDLPKVGTKPARGGAPEPVELQAPSGRPEIWVFKLGTRATAQRGKTWFEARQAAAISLHCEPSELTLLRPGEGE